MNTCRLLLDGTGNLRALQYRGNSGIFAEKFRHHDGTHKQKRPAALCRAPFKNSLQLISGQVHWESAYSRYGDPVLYRPVSHLKEHCLPLKPACT